MIRDLKMERTISAEFDNSGTYHLILFNERLNEVRRRPLNEDDFDDMLEAFPMETHAAPVLCCLTLSRIAELAVVTVGRYVDSGNFSAAGDFLANPKQVDVYVDGEMIPIRKKRHSRLSAQLAPMMNGAAPVPWLARNAITRIRCKAMMPRLRDMLESFGELSEPYLRHLDRRLCRAVDAMSFLMSWQIYGSEELNSRMQTVSASKKQYIEKNLCRFGWNVFQELGEDVNRIAAGGPEDCDWLPAGVECAESSLFFEESLCQY